MVGLVAGLIFLAGGVVLIFDVGGADDGLAAFARLFPGWMRGWGTDRPVYYRIAGAVWAVAGVAFIVSALGRG